MRQLVNTLLLLSLMLLGWNIGSEAKAQNPDFIVKAHGPFLDDYVKGRLMIRIKDEYRGWCTDHAISIPQLQPIFDQLQVYGVQRAFPQAQRPQQTHDQFGQRLVDLSLIYQLDYGSGQPMDRALMMFAGQKYIEYVEPHYLPQLMYAPNDPDTSSQYYLGLIRAYAAWDLSKGDTNVVIAITDLGTSFVNADLINKHHVNYAEPIDGVDNDNDGYIDNRVGWDFGGGYFGSPGDNNPVSVGGGTNVHGITVSGPAAAEPDNGYCMAGIGFNCRLMPLKISVDNLPVPFFGFQAAVYAADHGAHIINMSWGGSTRYRLGEDAINYATVNKGALCVAAGGNTPSNIVLYPAGYRNCMASMGSEDGDAFWYETVSFGSTYNYLADITAPSQDIYTTWDDGSCASGTGTSVGAPQTCGVAGLVKARYDSLNMIQVGQKVRMGADPNIYLLNSATYTERMGRGRLNAYDALNSNTPSIRIVDLWLEEDDNDDEEIQIGDTVWVHARFINWLSPVNDVAITMTSPTPTKVNVLHGSVDAGDLGTLDTTSIWLAPFRYVVTASAVAGERLYLRFDYAGTGYDDYEYIEFVVQPNYVNVDENLMETSINSSGVWGYMNYPTSSIGKGLIQDTYGLYVQEGGFMVGNSATSVSNSVRNSGGFKDAHFTSLMTANRSKPGTYADLEAYAHFNDNAAGAARLGVEIIEHVYQWEDSLADDYIIFEYKVVNTNSSALADVYAGHWIDWWMWNSYANHTRFDSATKMTYAWDNYHVNPRWLGLSLLTEQDPHPFAAQDSLGLDFDFSIASKWDALRADPADINYYNTEVVGMMSGGPVSIAAMDTAIFAFALVGSDHDTIPGLIDAAERAYQRYWCVVRGGMAEADLGPDVWNCHGEGGVTLDPGAGYTSYSWNTGASSPTLSVTESGIYSVLVTDGVGCEDIDYVEVSIGNINASFTVSPGPYMVGDTIIFTDVTSGSTEWGWDFGDGAGFVPNAKVVEHVFTGFGIYNVCVAAGNGDCADTSCITMAVDTVVGISDLSTPIEVFHVFPNPTSGNSSLKFMHELTGSFTLSITNALGQMVYTAKGSKPDAVLLHSLPSAQLTAGIYQVELRIGGNRWLTKLVVE